MPDPTDPANGPDGKLEPDLAEAGVEGRCQPVGQPPTPGTLQAFSNLVALINHLRGPQGCPWDQEQTHQSLRPYVIEEAYEVVKAIDNLSSSDPAAGNKLREELGDLLLQVLLHAEIASETGLFDLGSLLSQLHDKLVRRHPHVFAGEEAVTTAAVAQLWEKVKARERKQSGPNTDKGAGRPSQMDRVPRSLPAMLRSYKMQKEAAKLGFDWQRPEAALPKVFEEAREVRAAWRSGEAAELEAEVGDLFFALINVSRLLQINPEVALAGAAGRFEARFRFMEQQAAAGGRSLGDLSLDRQEALWQEAKRYYKEKTSEEKG